MDIDGWLQKTRVQLIAIDRPGMGLSAFHPKGNFLSFAGDAEELMNALGIRTCPVLCWSGGGPYALAIAHQFPQHISNVYIICGFTRIFDAEVTGQMNMNKWYFRSAKYMPWLLGAGLNFFKKMEPKKPVPRKLTGLPDVDWKYLKNPAHLNGLTRLTIKEASRNGAKGALHEARLYYDHFGFALSAIQQPVHYWWGTADNTVIHLHAEALEKEAPGARMHYKQGEGHLSIYLRYFEEVLKTISSVY